MHLRSVNLSAGAAPFEEADTEETRRWVQVCREGVFMGYRGGRQPFAFNRAHFDTVVANCHAHPRFTAGADGEGTTDVIPWDYEHAATGLDDQTQVARKGLPAIGWSSDMQVRDDEEGKAQLWALTRFIGDALQFVKSGQYKDASVELDFHYVDHESAQDNGATVLSIALTNRPFVQGMEPIAATADWYPLAASPQEAFESMRRCFGLPVTAGVMAVAEQLALLAGWEDTTAPVGVDAEGIAASLRLILGLPPLTDLRGVVDNARGIVQRLIDEAGPNAPALSNTPAAEPNGETMDPKTLTMLAALLGVRADEDIVKAEIADLKQLRDGVRVAVNASEREVYGTLVKLTAEGEDARGRLKKLLVALGVKDADALAERVDDLFKKTAELERVLPELSALRETVAKAEATAAEAEVDAVMSSYRMPPEAREGMVMLRSSLGGEKFSAKYPKRAEPRGVTPHQKGVLLRALPGGAHVPAGTPAAGAGGDPGVVNLSLYEGRNKTEKAMSYLRTTVEGWAKLSHNEQCRMAASFKNQPNVVDESAATA